MLGRLPLSQWLSTPALSLMSDPTRSQSQRIWFLAAAKTFADVRRGHLMVRQSSRAVCCPELCDEQQSEALP